MTEEKSDATWSSIEVKQQDKDNDSQEISKLVYGILFIYCF